MRTKGDAAQKRRAKWERGGGEREVEKLQQKKRRQSKEEISLIHASVTYSW